MTKEDVEILEKTVCFDGFFRLERYRLRYRLFSGSWSRPVVRELFERGHAAAVLPYDPVKDEVILIEQFRIGAMAVPGGPWLMEVVAGIIEGSESAADVVKRESLEEAACVISDLIPVWYAIFWLVQGVQQNVLPCFVVKSIRLMRVVYME